MNSLSFVVTILSVTLLLNKAPAHAKKHHVKNSNEVHSSSEGGSRNLRSLSSGNLNVMSREGGDVKEEIRDLIIGGTEIQEGDYPYLSLLFITSSNGTGGICEGTLIEPNWILTAAHCADKAGKAGNITALLGVHNISSSNITSDEEIHFIYQDDIHIYPGYDSGRSKELRDGDFALLYLSSGSNKTTPALNPDVLLPAEKDTVWVSVWGDLNPDDSTPSVPMEIALKVVGLDACDITIDTTSDMLCATGWGEGDSCYGDSGGPVVMKNPNGDHSKDILVGVVSGSKGCNHPNQPGIYSRVSAALSWILSMMPSAI